DDELRVERAKRVLDRRLPGREGPGHRLRVVLKEDDIRDRDQQRLREPDKRAFEQLGTPGVTGLWHYLSPTGERASGADLVNLESTIELRFHGVTHGFEREN